MSVEQLAYLRNMPGHSQPQIGKTPVRPANDNREGWKVAVAELSVIVRIVAFGMACYLFVYVYSQDTRRTFLIWPLAGVSPRPHEWASIRR